MSDLRLEVDVQEAVNYLTAELNNLERKQVVRKGLMDAAKIFQARGKINLAAKTKPHTGNLRRSFKTNYNPRYWAAAYAGFWRPEGNHAHLVDLGTKQRFTKTGQNRGRMPATYFWTDARISEEQLATRAIFDGVSEAIARIQSRFE